MNVVVPIAGESTDFKNIYKPFIPIAGRSLIKIVLLNHILDRKDKLIFIALYEHEKKYRVSKKLRSLFGDACQIKIIQRLTEGAPNSILEGAMDMIDNSEPLLIDLADVEKDMTAFYKDIKIIKPRFSGIIPVMKKKINDRPWGYIYLSPDRSISRIKEKQINGGFGLATMGLYYFSRGFDFVSGAKLMLMKKENKIDGQYLVAPIYNELISLGHKFAVSYNSIIRLRGKSQDFESNDNISS